MSSEDKGKREALSRSKTGIESSGRKQISELMRRERAHLDIVAAAAAAVCRVLSAAQTQHVDISNI